MKQKQIKAINMSHIYLFIKLKTITNGKEIQILVKMEDMHTGSCATTVKDDSVRGNNVVFF